MQLISASVQCDAWFSALSKYFYLFTYSLCPGFRAYCHAELAVFFPPGNGCSNELDYWWQRINTSLAVDNVSLDVIQCYVMCVLMTSPWLSFCCIFSLCLSCMFATIFWWNKIVNICRLLNQRRPSKIKWNCHQQLTRLIMKVSHWSVSPCVECTVLFANLLSRVGSIFVNYFLA